MRKGRGKEGSVIVSNRHFETLKRKRFASPPASYPPSPTPSTKNEWQEKNSKKVLCFVHKYSKQQLDSFLTFFFVILLSIAVVVLCFSFFSPPPSSFFFGVAFPPVFPLRGTPSASCLRVAHGEAQFGAKGSVGCYMCYLSCFKLAQKVFLFLGVGGAVGGLATSCRRHPRPPLQLPSHPPTRASSVVCFHIVWQEKGRDASCGKVSLAVVWCDSHECTGGLEGGGVYCFKPFYNTIFMKYNYSIENRAHIRGGEGKGGGGQCGKGREGGGGEGEGGSERGSSRFSAAAIYCVVRSR